MAWTTPTLVEIHRPRKQWLPAGRILTFTAIRSPTKKPGQKPGFDFGLPRLSAQPFSTPIALGGSTLRSNVSAELPRNEQFWTMTDYGTGTIRLRIKGELFNVPSRRRKRRERNCWRAATCGDTRLGRHIAQFVKADADAMEPARDLVYEQATDPGRNDGRGRRQCSGR
jgi:hypothetical protein